MRRTVNDSNLTERAPSTAPRRNVFSSVSWGETPRKSDEPTSSPLQINKGREDTGSEDLPWPWGSSGARPCVCRARVSRGAPCPRSLLVSAASPVGPVSGWTSMLGLFGLALGASGCSWSPWFWALASSCEILPHRRVLPLDADHWGGPCFLTPGSLPRAALARPSSCTGASSSLPQEAAPTPVCRLLETLADTFMTLPSLVFSCLLLA